MQNAFGPYTPTERKRLEERRIQDLMNLARALTMAPRRPVGLLDPGSFAPNAGFQSATYASGGGHPGTDRVSAFPYQQRNRNKDGTWDAPLANRDNIRGTSVDPEGPSWPRWKQTPPPYEEGDFISDEPFFDIDEISGKTEFYPPGKPLRDGNADGNPARRARIGHMAAGNSWRRRLLVARGEEPRQLLRIQADPKQPLGAQAGGAAERDMEPPNFRKTPHATLPGVYHFTTTERSWWIDAEGRPTPMATGAAVISRDDWPPPNGDGIPDSRQPGSPTYNGLRIIRPKTS